MTARATRTSAHTSLTDASLRGGAAACVAAAGALTLAGAAWPAPAVAHGLVARANLPIPAYVFAWVAAGVLIFSFVAVGRLWPEPQLADAHPRRVFSVPPGWDVAWGSVGVALFGLVVWSGLAGAQDATVNMAPTFVFVLFWVGIPILSVLFGDVFAGLSPWRALARAAAWTARAAGRRLPPPLHYPPRLGYWPAVAGALGYGWLELVFVGRDRPSNLALLALAYAAVQLVGMACFGIDAWTRRGDAFAVVFGVFGRLSPWRRRGDAVELCRPLSGVVGLWSQPGAVALLCTMIGVTAFDGASNGALWREPAKPLERAIGHLGLGGTATLELARTIGLLACVAGIYGLFLAGSAGMRAVDGRRSTRELTRLFAGSLAPIAFGYLLAHYFSLLVFQGQATASMISDPLGHGADVFGTAGVRIDYGLVSAAAIWYVQVLALLVGHVGGVLVAHDRAVATYGGGHAGLRAQASMLLVMVFLTCMGLFLLSAVGT
jgi:hypothetical protein